MSDTQQIELKSVRIAESIQSDPDLSQKVDRAMELLNRETTASAREVDATWDIQTDLQARRVVRLRLSDAADSVEGEFTERELDDEYSVTRRLSRLWGDLLQERSHRQLRHLHAVVQELSDDE